MKRIFFTTIFLFVAFLAFAQTKTIYVTRHGQRGDPKYQKKFKNCDEDALMPKGEQQATLLGQYLNEKGFKGTIYVSPYYRTLQTATFAANGLPSDLPMILEPRVQEICGRKDSSGKVRYIKKCITKNEIKENFPRVEIPRKVKFPWRLENETEAQTNQRIGETIDDILKNDVGDAFIVCHGGVMNSVIREMQKRGADFPKTKVYNCCLYTFTFDTQINKVISCSDETLNYLPDELITDNLAYILILPKRENTESNF